MRQLANSTVNRNIDKLIANTKFLNDKKYFKSNRWMWAHSESGAAQGKAGGCRCCNAGCYNATLENMRHNDKHSSSGRSRMAIVKLCSNCANKVKEKTGVEFNKDFAP